MHLKNFLSNPFNENNFIEFISQRFYGFAKNLKQSQYLGKVKLDDKSEIGFFIFKVDENKDIENTRVGFHHELKQYADKYILDGAIGAFYHPNQRAWRLSFIEFSYDDKHKQQVSSSKRFTFLLGNEKIRTALEQLKPTKYQNINQLKESFSVERVTKEFYKGLVGKYETLLSSYLTYPSDDNRKKEFAIRLIGRILFVKFLNKKGLIPDDIFEVTNGYYHEKLEPLFFEQLNAPKNERKAEFINNAIPFLNGGLFEPLALDYYEWNEICSKYINILKIDNKFFTELYEHLNHYNFTIDENSTEDSELSIDPEMLGRIFENLLAEINPETSGNARKSTGSYYTPREIVDYMVSSSLLEYLKTKTSIDEESLKTIIFKNQEPKNDYDKAKVLSALFELKILDPACGSGAFPMGLLQKIVKILKLIDLDATIWFGLQNKEFRHTHKDRNKDYIRKLSIIKNTIYGIDIQPIAIEISKLRFFLSLIVDEDGEPEPLPNLEFKFVCANSLLPFPLAKQKNQQTTIYDNTNNLNEIYKEIKIIKDKYFESASSAKSQTKQEYKEAQKKLLNEIIALGDGDISLVGYDPFDPLSVAGFFDSDFMFNIKDGFDIVIGNPPYIGEKGNKETFAPLKKLKYYQGKMDLFYFFFHVGLDNLKNGGILSLITTNYYITATGAVKLRNDFKERSTILNLINFNELKIFESALGQHNLITTIQKGKFDKFAHTSIVNAKGYLGTEALQSIVEGTNKDTNYYKIPQDKLFNNGNIQLTIGGVDDILDKIRNEHMPLKNTCIVSKGIETGANEVYIFDELPLFYESLLENEKKLFKPFYKNSNVSKYLINGKRKHLLYLSNSININKLPNIYTYLLQFRNKLENRAQIKRSNQNWYTLLWARDEKIFAQRAIVAPYRSKDVSFCLTNRNFYSGTDTYFITTQNNTLSLKYIMSILNSKLALVWFKNKGKLKGAILEMTGDNIEQFPLKIKDVNEAEQQPFIDLVDKIMELKAQNENTSKLENQIDEMVYKLYGLSDEEIGVVEGRE